MVSRRTWARLIFLGEMLSVPLQVYQLCRPPDEDGASISLLPRWLIAGGVVQAAYCWAYDRDLGAIRTKRLRRYLLAVVVGGLGLRTLPQSEAMWRNISIGSSIGRLGYRLWYGVLRPLPAASE
jgi:hypothetical protein